MTEEQKAAIIGYARKINSTLPAAPAEGGTEDDLLDFTVDEVADRVLIYLNREDLPENLLRIVAKVVVTGYQEAIKGHDQAAPEAEIASMSDNGQSVSFRSAITSYFTSGSDAEIFGSFAPLLSRYRRVSVVRQ